MTSKTQKSAVDQLLEALPWRPISNCAGRFVLRGGLSKTTPRQLIGEGPRIVSFRVPKVADSIIVARMDGGGLISYVKRDGTFIHTLNTKEGFQRKLDNLEIRLPRSGTHATYSTIVWILSN